MKDLLIVREYEFKGIKVTARLDRRDKTVSLVEWDDICSDYVNKRWLFAGRTTQYMQGWQNILNAMSYAIDEAKKVLETWKQEELEKTADLIMKVNEK